MIDTFALARSPFLEASTLWLQGWGAGKTISVTAWDLVGEDSESIRLKGGGLETLLLACSAHLLSSCLPVCPLMPTPCSSPGDQTSSQRVVGTGVDSGRWESCF